MRRALVVSFLVATASLLVVAPAPSYDAWSWLLWGDEMFAGDLTTLEGPSFKPLPVTVSTVLAPLGSSAAVLWVLLARAAAVLATVLAFRVGQRLVDGSTVAGLAAALGVVLCAGFLDLAAAGWSEGILVALILAGAESWRRGRPRWALVCGVAAALVRVETWPFLLVASAFLWRRRPEDRPLLVGAILAVPAAWIIPELIGSGELLRSASRARVPNPGQPGLSDSPLVASLREALALPLWPLLAGVTLTAWRAWRGRQREAVALLIPAAAGLAWIGIVAVMSWAGFSGEPRYALPGAALLALSGGAGLVAAVQRLQTTGAAFAGAGVLALAVVVAAVPRIDDILALPRSQSYQWRLQADLASAVALVGGRDDVLACGQPHVGPLRGPLLAHHLKVAKPRVEADDPPHAPGMVFRSALHAGEAPAPRVPSGFDLLAEVGPWQVYANCDPPRLVLCRIDRLGHGQSDKVRVRERDKQRTVKGRESAR